MIIIFLRQLGDGVVNFLFFVLYSCPPHYPSPISYGLEHDVPYFPYEMAIHQWNLCTIFRHSQFTNYISWSLSPVFIRLHRHDFPLG